MFYINYVCLSSKNISIRNTSQNGQEAIRNPVLNGRGVNKDNLTVIPLPRATSKQCNTTFGLKIAHINFRSLRNIALSIQLRELAISNNIDVLTISETWFNSTGTNSEISINGYNVYRLDRLHKKGGGVSAYIRKDIKASVIKELSKISDTNFHQLWIKLQCKKSKSLSIDIIS